MRNLVSCKNKKSVKQHKYSPRSTTEWGFHKWKKLSWQFTLSPTKKINSVAVAEAVKEKRCFSFFSMDLNLCVNEASAYADMKHSLRTYEVFATQIWSETRVTSPWAKGSHHRAKSCFIFHASQTRFTEKSQVEFRLGFFLGRGARTPLSADKAFPWFWQPTGLSFRYHSPSSPFFPY